MAIKFSLKVIDESNKQFHLAVRGGIDAATVVDFDEALNGGLKRGATWIIIDMTGVDYVSSSGVMRLLMADDQAREAGGQLVIYGTRSQVMGVFQLLEITERFNFLPTREEALAAAGPQAVQGNGA